MTPSTIFRRDAAAHSTMTQATSLPAAPAPSRGLGQLIKRAMPAAVVVGLLGGLVAFGFANNWQLPKFSAIAGGDAKSEVAWCTAHNLPEAECIECVPDLLPAEKSFGWCKVHGVMHCPLEHPEVAQVKTTPVIGEAELERAQRALAVRPRTENNGHCNLHSKRIQFASKEAVEKAGIDIAVVDEQPIQEAIVATGEVSYDQTRLAHLSSRVPGTLWRVEKQVGDRVKKGDVLALVDAAEVGKAKAELLQAVAQLRLKQTNVDRLRPLAADQTVTGRQFREAEAALAEAQIRLIGAQQTLVNLGLPVSDDELAETSMVELARKIQFLGLPQEIIAEFDTVSTTSNLLPLRSPLDGVVVERAGVAGEVVTAGEMQFVVSDLSKMWLEINVRQDEAKYVALGQPVYFRASDSREEPEIRGDVSWISTSADDRTRTVRVRIELPNDDRRLRANTFGSGRIVLRDEPKAIVVPSDAVHWDGTCNVVFVRDKRYFDPKSPKFFHVRMVRTGVKQGDHTEIIAGLLPGEVIAAKNSVVLESQLLKSNLGAGCGCAHGH